MRFLPLLFLLSLSCKSLNPFKAPTVVFKDYEIEDIGFKHADVAFLIEINNPNFIGLTFKQYFAELYIEETKLLTLQENKPSAIPPKKKTVIRIPARIDYGGLGQTIGLFPERDFIRYRLSGFFVIDSPIGPLRFRFEDFSFHKGTIRIPHIPSVSIEAIAIKSFDIISNIDLECILAVRNTNDFSFQLKQLSYWISLNNEEIAKARLDTGERNLEQGEVVRYAIPIRLKPYRIQAGLLRALKSGEIVYSLRAYLYIQSQQGDIKLPIEKKGSVSILPQR